MPAKTDLDAKIKLLGAALRLRHFSARELWEFAGVNRHTAQAFLKRESKKDRPCIQAVVRGENVASTESIRETGRPANHYQVVVAEEARLMNSLSDFRKALDGQARTSADTGEERLTTLDMFEAAVADLREKARGGVDPEERALALEEARIFRRGARGQVHAMSVSGSMSQRVESLLRRFQRADERLSAVEEDRFPPESAEGLQVPPALTAAERFSDICNRFVNRFGRWIVPTSDTFLEPVVVLLDGVKGEDSLSKKIIAECKANKAPAVVVDLERIQPAERSGLFAALDRLRATTPFALAEVIATLDGDAPHAKELGQDIKKLATFGAWKRKTFSSGRSTVEMDDEEDECLRAFFVKESTKCLNRIQATGGVATGTRELINAFRLTSALSVISASKAIDVEANRVFEGRARRKDKYKRALMYLREEGPKTMGNVHLLDVSHNTSIEADVSPVGVHYVKKANAKMKGKSLASLMNVGRLPI